MASTSFVKINGQRLMESLHHSCQWGAIPNSTGMRRLSLDDNDKIVRDWFREQVEGLGCKYHFDEMGNQFAILPGKNNELKPIAMGSHLDTQPAGGKYDGILGVLAGLEALKTIKDAGIVTHSPLALISWTNEEGARFPICMVSSGVWSAEIPLARAHNLADLDGKTMKEELERIGYKGDTQCSHEATPIACHFELHIEQGPILEAEKKMIGVVEGVQGMRWYECTVKGREAHTGTTPMNARGDALLTAAKCIANINRIAVAHDGLGTVGVIQSWPQAVNTIPGTVKFSVDLRHAQDDKLDTLEAAVRKQLEQHAKEAGVKLELKKTWDSPAINFHPDNVSCVRQAAEAAGLSSRPMRSGAGHDSVYTSKRVPTSMIFCPSKDGISHNPAEYSSDEECIAGAQVLLGAVLAYDNLVRSRAA
ncbi:putative N-carbamoyl-L-amino acid hydrolase [Protomyces lactucae-debilis]|uniref:Putative N-carbamoyl-L-amino acid hydrolase n=1 Tax=Protomyces lactucae-debilis TaxID=2754530 RepID=A0A1Y2FNT3_PROLT|nr:putative N-carbamoyl-L-amino acid hydrolase [Protomyces lactucae-debilis]ORY84876.1 putative N-carbamoyl-L-amino acid hydrolase [Protomyces lactucae-debilis]